MQIMLILAKTHLKIILYETTEPN